jgi:hypothetical protein
MFNAKPFRHSLPRARPNYTSTHRIPRTHRSILHTVYITTKENPNWKPKDLSDPQTQETNLSSDTITKLPSSTRISHTFKNIKKTTNCKNHTQKPESKQAISGIQITNYQERKHPQC